MVVQFPCAICKKAVAVSHKAVCCDICNQWVHKKCNNLDDNTYNLLRQDDNPWFCFACNKSIMPFSSVSENNYLKFSGTEIPKNIQQPDCNEDTIKSIQNNFYTPEEFNDLEIASDTHGTYLHINISSLSYHHSELLALISNLKIKPKIIAITESRLTTGKTPLTNISIPNYHIEHTPTESKKGGALLYISNDLKHRVRSDLKIYKPRELESIFIEIMTEKGQNLIVGCVYKHPKMLVNEFHQSYIEPLFEKLSFEKKKIMLMGDFNINLFNYDSDPNTSDFVDTIYSNSLLPYINIPTRITPRSQTLIDNIFYSELNEDIIAGNITSTMSDHLMQFLIEPSSDPSVKATQSKLRRSFKNFNKENFETELKRINWDTELELQNEDVNFSLMKFFDNVNKLLDKYAPFQKVSKKTEMHQSKPWITKGIRTSIKVKHKIYKRTCREKDPTKKETLFNKMKTYRNYVLMLIRKSKDLYYKQFFDENKKNSMKIWKAIKNIINIKSSSKAEPPNILINNQVNTNPEQVAEHFNEFFTNIASKIDSKIVPSNTTYQNYLNNPHENSFFLSPTTKNEIQDFLSTMKSNKAHGPNSIPITILKDFKAHLSQPLSDILNISFSTGVFPTLFKCAQVIPIFKSGDKLQTNNYRPISLLSNISKIIEKIVHRRLYLFLRQNKLLFLYQFGFRPGFSTTHALISLTDEIRAALDDDKFACGVFIDLQKAFDTVNHNILLSKLEYYGVRGVALDWFKTYLTKRTQFTMINNTKSTTKEIKYGVPQGSVLGPLLFLIYINDMNKAITHSKIKHFADDTNILYSSKSLKDINKKINHDLSNLVQWLRANRISLNVKKTDIVIFKPKQKIITKNLNFRISGQKILPTSSTKYLGLILDENLMFKTQLDILRKKLSRANGLLAKIRHYTSPALCRTIYYAIFNSHIVYANQVWGQSNQEIPNTISRLQNKAMRIINFKHSADQCNPLYSKLKILKFKDQITYYNCLFVHDFFVKNLPNVFNNYFSPLRDIHVHNTRGRGRLLLDVPRVKTRHYGSNSIRVKSTIDWNDMTDKVCQTKSPNSLNRVVFSNKIKEYFYQSYQNS